ncbi:MAG: FkbM family methyltransferase [Chloroflexus sp.]
MTVWPQVPLIKQFVEWRWAQKFVYPAGQLPWQTLLKRTIEWYWRRVRGVLDQPAILRIPYAPAFECIVPALKHEYSLFIHRLPLYEAEFFILPALVKPDMIALNVGAHIGLYTLALAQLLPRGMVYAFEPAMTTYQQLQINILWNRLRGLVPDNIAAFRLALGACDGEMRLFHESSAMQASLLPRHPAQPYESVPGAQLNTWLRTNHIDRVDFIVIDVEGAEEAVLSHATDLFQQHHQPLILCEFNRKFGQQTVIWEFLSQFGYRFWRYHSRKDQIVPVANPHDPAIYIHQIQQPGRGYGNVIAAPASWVPPGPYIVHQQRQLPL